MPAESRAFVPMDRKLKIGMICHPSLGGSGIVATEIGNLLAEKGHEVHFISHSIPFRLGTQLQKNVFYHELEVSDYYVFKHPPYDLTLANKMAQVAIAQQLDVLHVHYALPHAICAYLAKEIVGDHLKVVSTLHGTDITISGQQESLKDVIRLAINKSDAVTAVSKDLIRETRELLNITRNIDLTYNFVDTRVYYPREAQKLRNELGLGNERIIMHISNFRPVKRVDDVVEAFSHINKELPCRLVFVGEGPDLPKAQERIEELGLTKRVHFLGKRNDIPQVVSMADILLLPSEKESFGLVALEGMACGTPTIGSRAGGIPELIKHGETGYLVEIGDTNAMAKFAIQFFQHPTQMKQMRSKCVEYASREFGNDVMIKKYEQIYYRVLGNRMPRPTRG